MPGDFPWHTTELPYYWSYGVTKHGRVFFINDRDRFTTWCHPLAQRPVQSGYYDFPNLPKGWQIDVDDFGDLYFIDHLNEVTTRNPPSLQAAGPPEERSYNAYNDVEEPTTTQKMKVETNPSVPKFSPIAVETQETSMEVEGYLLRQEGIFRQWKQRWFNLAGNHLFCYKEKNEKQLLTTYQLEGSNVIPCYGEAGILKQYAFKIARKKKKPVYMAAESLEDFNEWMRALLAGTTVSQDGEPFPHHLAQRSSSFSGPRSSKSRGPEGRSEDLHRRSQSYRDLDRSRIAASAGGGFPPERGGSPGRVAAADDRGIPRGPARSWSAENLSVDLVDPRARPESPPARQQPLFHGRTSMNGAGRTDTSQIHGSTQAGLPLNLDDSTKTWKSFGRPYDDGGFDRNNSFQNRSFMAAANPPDDVEQLYSKVVKPRDRPSPSHQQPQLRQSLGVPQSTGLSSRAPSGLSLQQQSRSDDFASSSRHDFRPSPVPRNSPTGFRPGGLSPGGLGRMGPTAAVVGRSVDSLDTLRTGGGGSSRSSSKNTYYLSSPANPDAFNDVNNVNSVNNNNNNIGRNDSYFVVSDGPNDPRNPARHSPRGFSNPATTAMTGGRSNRGGRMNIPRNFSAIKEDPDMPDDQVLSSRNLEDLQRKLANHTRLRLSISIQDLMGKSYQEVVLLLIQMKRSQSELQEMCKRIKRRLSDQQNSVCPHQAIDRKGLERRIEDAEKQMEAARPLIDLLDNMLTMGSLFNGNDLMYASEYKKNQLRPDELVPPKAMLEFNRSRQEALVGKTRPRPQSAAPLAGAPGSEELEEELKELHRLDILLQERSCAVADLQKDKEMIERAIEQVKAKLSDSPSTDPAVEEHLFNQSSMLERDLSATVVQLADASKRLEDTTADMVRSEQRVIHLRNRVNNVANEGAFEARNNDGGSENNKNANDIPGAKFSSNPTRLRQMEQRVEEIGQVLKGTTDRMQHISDDISNLRRSRSSRSLTRSNGSSPERGSRSPGLPTAGYLETDLDRNITKDISLQGSRPFERASRRDRQEVRPGSSHRPDLDGSSNSRSSSMPRRGDADRSGYDYQRRDHQREREDLRPSDGRFQASSSSLLLGQGRETGGFSSRPHGSLAAGRGGGGGSGIPSPHSQSSAARTSGAGFSDRSFGPVVRGGLGNSSGIAIGNSNNRVSVDEANFNEMTIDDAFRPPPQVRIPQRYRPEIEDDRESLDPLDIFHKQQKAEQVKKLLAMQSLQDFTVDELGRSSGNIGERVRSELREREGLLEIKKDLARQVMERSRTFNQS